jgi:hypothetical protein
MKSILDVAPSSLSEPSIPDDWEKREELDLFSAV